MEFGYRYLEMVQATRRAAGVGAFPYRSEDLRLPLQVLAARREYARDPDVNARLDAASAALSAGDSAVAATILSDYADAP